VRRRSRLGARLKDKSELAIVHYGVTMTRTLTKAEARAFRKRWQRVNAREEEELHSTCLEARLQQFNTLLGWAYQLGWAAALGEGEAEVRQRWARLRKACRG
jgi:hypothetical protein